MNSHTILKLISMGVYVGDVWPQTGVVPTLQHYLISLEERGRENERYFWNIHDQAYKKKCMEKGKRIKKIVLLPQPEIK